MFTREDNALPAEENDSPSDASQLAPTQTETTLEEYSPEAQENLLNLFENRLRAHYQQSVPFIFSATLEECWHALDSFPKSAQQERLTVLRHLYHFTLTKQPTPYLFEWLQKSTEDDEPLASSIKATLKIQAFAELSRHRPEIEADRVAKYQEEIISLLATMRDYQGLLFLDNLDLSFIKLARENNLVEGIDLSGTSFVGATLSHASLSGCLLREANFQHADLSSADFKFADLTRAKIQHADCTGADFSKANAQLMVTDDTVFTKVKFSRTNLRGIHFHKSTIDGASFLDANLTFSLFTSEQLAMIEKQTTLPRIKDIRPFLKKEKSFLIDLEKLMLQISSFMSDSARDPWESNMHPVLIDAAVKKIILERESYWRRPDSTGVFISHYNAETMQEKIEAVRNKFYLKHEFLFIKETLEDAVEACNSTITSFNKYTEEKTSENKMQLQYDVINFLALLFKLKSCDPLDRFNDYEGRIAMEIINNPHLLFPPPAPIDEDFFNFSRRPVEKSMPAETKKLNQVIIADRVNKLRSADEPKINAYWCSLFPKPQAAPAAVQAKAEDEAFQAECRRLGKMLNPMSGGSA